MNSKLIFGVGIPFLVVLVLIGLSVFGGDFEVELDFKTQISNTTQELGTLKITNNYFMPRKEELPNLIACPYYQGDVRDPALNLNYGNDVWAGSAIELKAHETREYTIHMYGLVYEFPVKDAQIDEVRIYELEEPWRYSCSGLSGELASISVI